MTVYNLGFPVHPVTLFPKYWRFSCISFFSLKFLKLHVYFPLGVDLFFLVNWATTVQSTRNSFIYIFTNFRKLISPNMSVKNYILYNWLLVKFRMILKNQFKFISILYKKYLIKEVICSHIFNLYFNNLFYFIFVKNNQWFSNTNVVYNVWETSNKNLCV